MFINAINFLAVAVSLPSIPFLIFKVAFFQEVSLAKFYKNLLSHPFQLHVKPILISYISVAYSKNARRSVEIYRSY
jgi:uncharacterized membrane protein YbaN (DUF454 family)